METITIILGLVMLVFGILQIILFFKVWGMTNDVRKMFPKILVLILKLEIRLSSKAQVIK